jgi:hypothetical protein
VSCFLLALVGGVIGGVIGAGLGMLICARLLGAWV